MIPRSQFTTFLFVFFFFKNYPFNQLTNPLPDPMGVKCRVAQKESLSVQGSCDPVASLCAGLSQRAVPMAAIGSVLERILSKYHDEASVCKLSVCIYMMCDGAEAGTMNHSGSPSWRASNSA